MPDENFGDLLSFSDIEVAVLAHYKLWMHTWLCARERKVNIEVGSLARPRSYLVKQTFTALPGEEQTPIVIAVCDGFATEPARRGTGDYDANLRFGIAVMCMGNSARVLCGHYQAALLGIALHNRSIADGIAKMADFVDMRIDNVEEEALGRVTSAVRLELIYNVQSFGSEVPALNIVPIEPPPEEPQPDDPQVETVTIDVENYLVSEEVPGG